MKQVLNLTPTKRIIWIVGIVTALIVGLSISRIFAEPVVPYTRDFDADTAWDGLEITFKTDGPEGPKVWEYVRGNDGQWRLQLLEDPKGDRTTTIFDGKTSYFYDSIVDRLSEQSTTYQIEAGYVLRPHLALIVGDPNKWEVVGRLTMQGFNVVEVLKKDGSERLWINPERGLPVKWLGGDHTWELLTAKFDQQHEPDRFAPPQAAHTHKLPAAPKP